MPLFAVVAFKRAQFTINLKQIHELEAKLKARGGLDPASIKLFQHMTAHEQAYFLLANRHHPALMAHFSTVAKLMLFAVSQSYRAFIQLIIEPNRYNQTLSIATIAELLYCNIKKMLQQDNDDISEVYETVKHILHVSCVDENPEVRLAQLFVIIQNKENYAADAGLTRLLTYHEQQSLLASATTDSASSNQSACSNTTLLIQKCLLRERNKHSKVVAKLKAKNAEQAHEIAQLRADVAELRRGALAVAAADVSFSSSLLDSDDDDLNDNADDVSNTDKQAEKDLRNRYSSSPYELTASSPSSSEQRCPFLSESHSSAISSANLFSREVTNTIVGSKTEDSETVLSSELSMDFDSVFDSIYDSVVLEPAHISLANSL